MKEIEVSRIESPEQHGCCSSCGFYPCAMLISIRRQGRLSHQNPRVVLCLVCSIELATQLRRGLMPPVTL